MIPSTGTGDPYPLYDVLRAEDPAHWSESWGGWLLTRHQDVARALRDPRLSLGGGMEALFSRIPPDRLDRFAFLRSQLALWMGSLDELDHARVRHGFLAHMGRPYLAKLRPEVESMARGLLLSLQGKDKVDLIGSFAYPLAAMTVAVMMGAPREDRALFQTWAATLNDFLGCGFFDEPILERTQDMLTEMTDYVARLLARGQDDPGLSIMPAVREAGLSTQEVTANCALLLFAGYETTGTLIGTCIELLVPIVRGQPGIAEDRGRLNRAVEEVLRYESPIQMVRRAVVAEVEYGERRLAPGDVVWLSLGAANRDPAVFQRANLLDIGRHPNPHVAFGAGPHYCLGAALSRLEAEIAVQAVCELLPSLVLIDRERQWKANPTLRSLLTIPATIAKQ